MRPPATAMLPVFPATSLSPEAARGDACAVCATSFLPSPGGEPAPESVVAGTAAGTGDQVLVCRGSCSLALGIPPSRGRCCPSTDPATAR
jgi:hypothetical protein